MLLRVFIIGCFLVTGCVVAEPGPKGDEARTNLYGAINTILPPPWGAIVGTATTSILGGVALMRDKSARRAEGKAVAHEHAAEAATFGIEEVYQLAKKRAESGDATARAAVDTIKQVKAAAGKASKMLNVPTEFEEVVSHVIKKNGFGGK